MAEDYEELIELGFEGMDKFADKYYDNVYGWLPRRPHLFHREGRQQARQGQGEKSNEAGTRRNERGGNDEDDKEGDGDGDGDEEEEFEEAGPRPYGYQNDYSRRRNQALYGGAYGAAQPRMAQPAYGYGQRPYMDGSPRQYAGEMRADERAQRPRQRQLQRRASSYSPPRERRYPSPERRRRYSKSPEDDRVTATIMGALAGGLIGGAARRGSVLSTVGGAVVGGIAAREGDKLYDRFEEKRDERRERRRKREHRYSR